MSIEKIKWEKFFRLQVKTRINAGNLHRTSLLDKIKVNEKTWTSN